VGGPGWVGMSCKLEVGVLRIALDIFSDVSVDDGAGNR